MEHLGETPPYTRNDRREQVMMERREMLQQYADALAIAMRAYGVQGRTEVTHESYIRIVVDRIHGAVPSTHHLKEQALMALALALEYTHLEGFAPYIMGHCFSCHARPSYTTPRLTAEIVRLNSVYACSFSYAGIYGITVGMGASPREAYHDAERRWRSTAKALRKEQAREQSVQ